MRKIIITAGIVVLACLSFAWNSHAQRQLPQQDDASQVLAAIDKLAMKLDYGDRDISKKLDQVLSNQAAILKELDIVKIRATRK